MERKEREKEFPESQISFEYFQKKIGNMGKERSSSQNLKSVSSNFRNTMEKKEKRKAVPRVSNKFRVLSKINRKYRKRSSSRSLKSVSSTFRNTMERKDKRKAVSGVSNQFRVLSEIKRKYGKSKKQFLES